MESLKNCLTRTVVVATDVAARGLDIPTVAVVIHYDAARTMDTFVHRSGRTAVGCSVKITCVCGFNRVAHGDEEKREFGLESL